MKFFLSLILLLASTSVFAVDHFTTSFGPSLNGSTNPKMGAIGYEKVMGNFSVKLHCGAIFQSPWNPWCATVFSTRVETTSGLFMRSGVGPAYFKNIDERLSSRWNFNISTAVGLTQDGFAVGLEHNHFSNAGLTPPNLGRDHLCLIAEIKI